MLWLIFFPLQIFSSFCVSLFLISNYPYISVDLSNRVLSSLIDVLIALFGFVGLILVFTFGNLLTTKRDLQKEKFDVELKKTEFERQILPSLTGGDVYAMGKLMDIIKNCEKRLEEINNRIAHNKRQINDASLLGVASLGIGFVSILINIWTFGAVDNEGLHFFHLIILLSLFFLWLDVIFKLTMIPMYEPLEVSKM